MSSGIWMILYSAFSRMDRRKPKQSSICSTTSITNRTSKVTGLVRRSILKKWVRSFSRVCAKAIASVEISNPENVVAGSWRDNCLRISPAPQPTSANFEG